MPNNSIQQIVSHAGRNCGFHLAGIAPAASDVSEDSMAPARGLDSQPAYDEQTFPELSCFAQWIDEGRAGEMEYLKRRDADGRLLRSSVRVPFPWVRSVVVCAVNYNSDQPYSIDSTPTTGVHNPAWIARYAWSGKPATDGSNASAPLAATDYHSVIRERLESLRADLQATLGDFQARCFVDTGPLVERVYAKYAGLGWQGKNTCLINQSIGSWFFLGVILTSLELPHEQWAQPMPDRCGSCTRCIDACPTDALEPYRMDASRCISYLTIEKRGAIPEELAAKVGRNVFGCDICQEVCPWNDRKNNRLPVTDWPELQPRPELVNPALEWLAGLGEEGYRQMFRKSPLERAKYVGFERNVANAQQNDPKNT